MTAYVEAGYGLPRGSDPWHLFLDQAIRASLRSARDEARHLWYVWEGTRLAILDAIPQLRREGVDMARRREELHREAFPDVKPDIRVVS